MPDVLYRISHIDGASQIGVWHEESGLSVTIDRPYAASTTQLAELVESLPEILIRIGEDLAAEHLPPVADVPRRRASDWDELEGQATLW